MHLEAPTPALPHIHQRLKPVVFLGDPLHVAGVILAPSAQGNDVIHMPARAGASLEAGCGAGLLIPESPHLGLVSGYLGEGGEGEEQGGSNKRNDVASSPHVMTAPSPSSVVVTMSSSTQIPVITSPI